MQLVCRVVLAAMAVLVMVACGSQSPQTPAAPAGGAKDRIEITVKEWAVEPKEIAAKAGKVTFVVKNGGNIEHNFDITGVSKIDSILPGETKTLEVDLKPGDKIAVICSLSGHKEAGMVANMTVVP